MRIPLVVAASLLGLAACQGPPQSEAQVSMTPMKPNQTPAAMRTIGEAMPTPAMP
jgi:hypothetical protein